MLKTAPEPKRKFTMDRITFIDFMDRYKIYFLGVLNRAGQTARCAAIRKTLWCIAYSLDKLQSAAQPSSCI